MMRFGISNTGTLGERDVRSLSVRRATRNRNRARLDTEFGSAYNVVINHAQSIRKAGSIAERMDWISNVRDNCADEGCLVNAHASNARADLHHDEQVDGRIRCGSPGT